MNTLELNHQQDLVEEQEARVTVEINQVPEMSVTKQANRLMVDGANQRIGYEIRIRNEGNIDLTQLQVVDELIAGSVNNLQCSPVAQGTGARCLPKKAAYMLTPQRFAHSGK